LTPVWSDTWNGRIDLFSGYRNDKITSSIETEDAASILVESDELSVDQIRIVEIGLRADLTLFDCWSLGGYGSTGWVQGGSYVETLEGSVEPFFQRNTASLTKSSCQDASIHIGYCYPVTSCLGIGILGGWSWDVLRIKLHQAEENGLPNPVLNGLKYKITWEGPWVGCESFYELGLARLHVVYEWHQPNWTAHWLLEKGPVNTNAFSDTRRGKDGQGQVVFIDLFYPLTCYCQMGLKIQYQYWLVRNGRPEPQIELFQDLVLVPGQVSRVRRATWSSASAQLELSCHF
jgi:hypothetical protein